MKTEIEFAQKISMAYTQSCKKLCHEMKLTQTSFDILMFLANNPEYTTASDIVNVRKLKANLVSVNIEKLVQEGYILRQNVDGDRRKTKLICTSKADKIINQGRITQQNFINNIFYNIDKDTKAAIFAGLKQMEINLDNILKGGF